MRGWIIAIAIVCAWPAVAAAQGTCGNGKVDASTHTTCAPCVAGSTNCPCAEVRTPLEPCDGRDFDGATCQTQGFFGGALRCTARCKLDTSRCTSVKSDLTLRHRTVGAEPRLASLAFNTNVISVGAAGATSTTITPYNYDFRGPWGKASTLAGAAAVITGTSAIAHKAKTLELVGVDYQGGARSLHSFGDRRALAWTQGFRGGALVALVAGANASELVFVDDTGKVTAKSLMLPGVVRALSWHQEGFVAAYVDDAAGELHVAWLTPAAALTQDATLGPAPASCAIAPIYPLRALVVRGGDDGAVASIVVLDKKAITVETDLKLTTKRARVVAAGYVGSEEGNYVILDDGAGHIDAARIKDGKATLKRVIDLRGAVALAATTGYQNVYVAWSQGKKLHLSSYAAQF
jgi:hypothetical protein